MHIDSNALSFLERSARRCPHRVAVTDGGESLTYAALEERSKRIGSSLIGHGVAGRAVVIAMEKSCVTLSAMMGVLYAGAHYVPVDPNIPEDRIERILDVLDHPMLVMDRSSESMPSCVEWYDNTIDVAELMQGAVNEAALYHARKTTLQSDPAYVLFTSGSTGSPKGVAISHRAIVCFINSFVGVLGIRPDDRIGNQAPFDFDVSTKDIYGAFASEATLVLVPRTLFMQPANLVAFLSEQHVTVLVWAVAALCIVSSYHALDQTALPDLRIVAFSGEMMSPAHLREWRDHVPHATFFNLYGPTEITCNCLYLRLDSERSYDDGIPLGDAFPHCEVLVVNDKERRTCEPGEVGEIIVRGPSLALGYVGAEELSKCCFTQNPLHEHYPDRVYRTGDLAVRSETGELFFCGRKDNQIKHMGHRIELEEIDLAVEQLQTVQRCRCVYDRRRRRIRAFYEGEATEGEVRRHLAHSLPIHMRPSTVSRVSGMPLNKNGKVDRAQLLDLVRSASGR